MKKQSIQEKLSQLGFSANESHIYLTLLTRGLMKGGEIIAHTKLQRSAVYLSLKKLIEKGLVAQKDSKVAQYYITDPSQIIEIQKDNLKDAEDLVVILQKERASVERNAFVYEGNDIVTTVAKRSLQSNTGSTVYFFGPSKFGVQANLERFWINYHKEREQKGIAAKILYDRFVPRDVIKQRNTYNTCEARYLPIDIEVPISFVIWDSHVAVLIPGENPPTVIFINSQQTADTLVEYFNYMWKRAV